MTINDWSDWFSFYSLKHVDPSRLVVSYHSILYTWSFKYQTWFNVDNVCLGVRPFDFEISERIIIGENIKNATDCPAPHSKGSLLEISTWDSQTTQPRISGEAWAASSGSTQKVLSLATCRRQLLQLRFCRWQPQPCQCRWQPRPCWQWQRPCQLQPCCHNLADVKNLAAADRLWVCV